MAEKSKLAWKKGRGIYKITSGWATWRWLSGVSSKTDKGKLNKLIDDLMHPYFKEYPAMIIVDGLLHAIVEQDPDKSLNNFIRYNIPKLLREVTRKRKKPKLARLNRQLI